jgi:hypothetical protein
MDVWSQMIELCGPQRMKKKIELRQGNKNRREANQSGRSREISVFPLTKLIMDVPVLSDPTLQDYPPALPVMDSNGDNSLQLLLRYVP